MKLIVTDYGIDPLAQDRSKRQVFINTIMNHSFQNTQEFMTQDSSFYILTYLFEVFFTRYQQLRFFSVEKIKEE
jgi:hypothetical protein